MALERRRRAAYKITLSQQAEVAELADALASGASSRKGVEVQVLSSALLQANNLRQLAST